MILKRLKECFLFQNPVFNRPGTSLAEHRAPPAITLVITAKLSNSEYGVAPSLKSNYVKIVNLQPKWMNWLCNSIDSSSSTIRGSNPSSWQQLAKYRPTQAAKKGKC